MRIVIAPDKFKGSLSAPEVARHLDAGLQSATGHNLDVLRLHTQERHGQRPHRAAAPGGLRGPRP
jgi:glycerate kinase